MTSIRVLLVDDHTLVRQGLAALLASFPEVQVVAEANDGLSALARFREHKPDVTLMDLRMPGQDGVGAIGDIRKEFPDSRFLVLTTYDGDDDVWRALRAGADGYLLKDVDGTVLVDAIRVVHAGRRYLGEGLADRALQGATTSDLTPRELDVLRLVAEGLSNAHIADRLSLAESTVKVHVKHVIEKLGVSNRTQAALAALERGLFRGR